jgi:hypothetical protein
VVFVGIKLKIMSKDPAFLFYPGDWLGGTMGMSFELKGCYLELLILQFNTGKFTEAYAKHTLNLRFDYAWPTLKQKFKNEGDLFWNERLQIEIDKRRGFIESRRLAGLSPKKSKAHAKRTLKRGENENENKNVFDLKFCEPIYLESFQTWLDYKKERGEKYKGQKSLEACYNKLMQYSHGGNLIEVKEIIEISMAKNYSGFFPLKTNQPKQKLSVMSGTDFNN